MMRSRLPLTIALLSGTLLLSACGNYAPRSQGMAALPEATLPSPGEPVTPETAERIAERYQEALTAADDPAMRTDIRWRLADLAMASSERALAESDSVEAQFEAPIARYRALIADYEAGRWPRELPEADRLYYQLAKAYALDGRMVEANTTLAELAQRFPQSDYYAEAQFRRAERAFSVGDYATAAALYRELLPGEGPMPEFGQNALYMRAWAQFKQAEYERALESFARVLDHLLPEVETPTALEQVWNQLDSARAEVAGDALRAMALSFAYLEGPDSIRALEARIGPRVYEHKLYQRLAETYREQERFRDAADTYVQYVEQNPNSDLAPAFSLSEIDTYREGRFPSLILPAKQAFIRRYGLLSAFWFDRGGEPGERVEQHLHEFLADLANYQHARAQRLADEGAAPYERRQAFADAATWYREFVATFPNDPAMAEQQFLLAEVLNEAEQWPEALENYEQVAFVHRDAEYGREAGYAAVLLSGQLSERAGPENLQWWQRRLTVGRLFAQRYPADPRSTAVLASMARGQLDRNYLESAADLAETLLAWHPPASVDEQFTGWLVLGHSRFDLNQYAAAEQAYWQVLERWPTAGVASAGAPTQAEVRERIAASLYQRARTHLDRGETAEAVVLLQRIPDELPNTDVAVQAQFDTAHYLLALERWSEAQEALERFRRAYPNSPLQSQIPARLAKVYREQENWVAAADELRRLEQVSDDPALQKESLYLAAELYQQAEETESAIDSYRRYAHTYLEPAADRREAEYQLTELYRQTGQTEKRHFWLQRLVDGHNADSGRSTYLAAFAASELAEESFQAFSRIKLDLPLTPSLERKRSALERALADQEAILEYGVAEFSTGASHRMAAIYHQLSRDLMASERPEGLGVLELEQYDILLEEQAYPFEEKAIDLYEINARRTRRGVYDQWVKRSFEALAQILPARYGKEEQVAEVSRGLY
ncbi:tetratricopeptide repeat protein [Marinimicrobium locisalis]|uniref:tetratricopeptide repeat protein n=1 Tax=Marinimicrobium locisalis TaxID=546022 RepID=UPI003221A84C